MFWGSFEGKIFHFPLYFYIIFVFGIRLCLNPLHFICFYYLFFAFSFFFSALRTQQSTGSHMSYDP